MPEMKGYFLEHANFVAANPLVTPEHIAPVWYFTPFYSVLRAIPDPFFGVIAMGSAVVVLFFLPWIDGNPVKSIRSRSPLHKFNLFFFVAVFLFLGWLGTKPATPFRGEMALRFSELYFLFFIVLWAHSRIRSALFYISFTVILVAILSFYDFAIRANDDIISLIINSWAIPVVYLAITLVLPVFTRLAVDGHEPDRVTS